MISKLKAPRLFAGKALVFSLGLAALVLLPTKLHAASMDYNFSFTLTDTANSAYDGNGTFTLLLPSAPTAGTSYPGADITALSITIDNNGSPVTFNLTDPGASATAAQFLTVPSSATPGSTYTLEDLTFSDTITKGSEQYNFQSTADYVYEYRCTTNGCSYTVDYGDYFENHSGDATLVSITTPGGATPEPSSFLLLGTGLLGGAGSLYRRFKLGRA